MAEIVYGNYVVRQRTFRSHEVRRVDPDGGGEILVAAGINARSAREIASFCDEHDAEIRALPERSKHAGVRELCHRHLREVAARIAAGCPDAGTALGESGG